MSDFLHRARATAEREAQDRALGVKKPGLDYGGEESFVSGFTTAVSRLPSEEEITREIDAAIYVSINPLLDRGSWKAAQRAARAVRELIEKKMLES